MSDLVDRPLDHWSLHREEGKYELLCQIRPTEALDGVLLLTIERTAIDLLGTAMVREGRVPKGPAHVTLVWFKSEWVRRGDGAFFIHKRSCNRDEGDDVMLVVSCEYQQ